MGLMGIFITRATSNLIEGVLPQSICYVSIVVFTGVLKKPLLSSYTVLIISYFQNLCQTFGYSFIRAVMSCIDGFVSLQRIQVRHLILLLQCGGAVQV